MEDFIWKTDVSSPRGDVHVCNCIGCCPKCGFCRTHPKHTPDRCAKLQALNEERRKVFEDE